MTKKITLISIICCIFVLLSCGCEKQIVKESIEKGDNALNVGEYDKALGYYEVALSEGGTEAGVTEIINIIKTYKEAKANYDSGKLDDAKTKINSIAVTYVNYPIKKDVEILKTNIDNAIKKYEQEQKNAKRETPPLPPPPPNNNPNVSENKSEQPFYGVWCLAAKDSNNAYKLQSELINEGFSNAKVFISNEWSNLNSEKYYVVTAGVFSSKEMAESTLQAVKSKGYNDAYIKYSGNKK